ncbi:serine palmitoyltransferase-like protein [Leptotrombidium deliense]|uniref:serine C-palmitoyltransferase n=1 Tax=Leptotrombidium deliense TaxID=299467 RepID=A0A443SJD2_9ACAR|nr:serine palmitoyltransferase-like protein [Leptotrombidium deliense]
MGDVNEKTLKIVIITHIGYLVLIVFGYLRDLLRALGIEKNALAFEKNRKGYAPLYRSFESFYTRNMYRRFRDAWNVPIASIPGPTVSIMERVTDDYNWSFRLTGKTKEVINLGSYNYLGFAENNGKRIDSVERAINEYGIGVASTRHEFGTTAMHRKLENQMSRFLGVEDCIVFGMGFATNSTNLPTLVGKGCLILSDEFNHASLILGSRLSGATIKIFKHNGNITDMKDLERKLREAVVNGEPRTHRRWKKILIVVEGIYSMEGTVVDLPTIIQLKKKYKAYLYLDEAHSIGAMGSNGKGVIDFFGCDPKDVDIIMGTFTKSFGSAGGYIAGSKQLVDYIRINSHSFGYATSMSPPIIEKIVTVLNVLSDEKEGKERINRLAQNTSYFRTKLKELGFTITGNDHSPVVPLMIYIIGTLPEFVREAHRNGIATVGVGYPATALTGSRIRFCLSASHTREMLDETLRVVDQIGDKLWIKYSKVSSRRSHTGN